MILLAMMNTITRSNFGEKDYLFYVPTTLHHPGGSKRNRQNLEARTEAETMEACCVLAGYPTACAVCLLMSSRTVL